MSATVFISSEYLLEEVFDVSLKLTDCSDISISDLLFLEKISLILFHNVSLSELWKGLEYVLSTLKLTF